MHRIIIRLPPEPQGAVQVPQESVIHEESALAHTGLQISNARER